MAKKKNDTHNGVKTALFSVCGHHAKRQRKRGEKERKPNLRTPSCDLAGANVFLSTIGDDAARTRYTVGTFAAVLSFPHT